MDKGGGERNIFIRKNKLIMFSASASSLRDHFLLLEKSHYVQLMFFLSVLGDFVMQIIKFILVVHCKTRFSNYKIFLESFLVQF